MLAAGALAFVLAHEMGHLYLGGTDVSLLTKPLLRYELGARWYIVYSL
jgi:hypothetical protein